MTTTSGSRLQSDLGRITGIACVAACVSAVVALLGWLLRQPTLTTVLPSNPSMNPLTAICLVLAAAATWIKRSPDRGARAQSVAQVCAGLVVGIGVVRLFSVLSGIELHVDQVIFRDQLLAANFQSRMGAYSAAALVCLGLGLLTLDVRTRWGAGPAEGLLFGAVAVSVLGLIGYLYGAPVLHGLMALGTSFALFLLSAAALLTRSDRGFCALTLSATPGGTLVRRVLPAAVLVPFALAWVRIQGQRAGLYGLEVGTGLLALIIVGFLVRMVVTAARELNVADAERGRAEEALRKSVERQNLLLESTLIGVLSADERGTIVEANSVFLDLIGYAREELPLTWESITPPEWHHKSEFAKREIAERGRATPFEKEYLHKDGTRVPVLIGAATMPGTSAESVAFIVDLRGKRRAELEIDKMRRFLDSVFENLPNMVFVKDAAELRFVQLNRAGEELLGLSRESLIGKNDYDFFPAEQADFFVAKDRSVMESRQLLDIPEEPVKTARGETRILHTKKVPILDAQGVPQYLLGISEDITAHKRAEKELAALNEGLRKRTQELELANKELESFSYSVSHDLRAPLRHVDGFTDLLTRHAGPSLDETGLRYLETISSSAKQMGRLIDDLLSFSRMSRTEMEHAAVDLNRVVADALESLRDETAGKDISWHVDTLPVLRGDVGMMRLVFTNLLSNAVKYSGTRPQARIQVGAREADDEVIVYVKDNGVGFDMQYVHKLFGVFQRLHGDDEFEGTGIGLANVQRIIHRHGGRTWAEAEVDLGATFYVALPRGPRHEIEEVKR
jgi:PAS domain S-box-containing protein